MEVHRVLGMGFSEIVYKDALEVEFGLQGIPFYREKPYKIDYKGWILRHGYSADFIIFDSIVLEVKASSMIITDYVAQTIAYLKASGYHLGIIANFGQPSLASKRVVF